MKLQVLLSTMNQKDFSIVEKIGITTNAIIINQCEKNQIDTIKNNKILFMSLKEKGVGLSRNTALQRANADICIFADDDVKYDKDYEQIIIKEFDKNPKADVIIFNIHSTNPERPEYQIKKKKRVNMFTCLKYGTSRIAIRLDKVRANNINFSLLFGGGAKYSQGEDTLFLRDCLRKRLKIYKVPECIGTISHDTSTWFRGYNEKYIKDRGAFYKAFSPRLKYLFCIQYVFRHKEFREYMNRRKALKLMLQGIKEAEF